MGNTHTHRTRLGSYPLQVNTANLTHHSLSALCQLCAPADIAIACETYQRCGDGKAAVGVDGLCGERESSN